MISGVPQGLVLAPIMFLVYVNNMTGVSSYISLFADDAKIYEKQNSQVQTLRQKMAKQEIVIVRTKTWTKDHEEIIEDTLESI